MILAPPIICRKVLKQIAVSELQPDETVDAVREARLLAKVNSPIPSLVPRPFYIARGKKSLGTRLSDPTHVLLAKPSTNLHLQLTKISKCLC